MASDDVRAARMERSGRVLHDAINKTCKEILQGIEDPESRADALKGFQIALGNHLGLVEGLMLRYLPNFRKEIEEHRAEKIREGYAHAAEHQLWEHAQQNPGRA